MGLITCQTVLIKTLTQTYFSILVTVMKGKQSPGYEQSDYLYNKGITMPDKSSDIKSLKTIASAGEKTRLSKQSKYKQTFILWSFVLHAFDFSVSTFCCRKQNSVVRSTWILIPA